jgi:MPBQ/MSBQ methyltransferase
MMKNKAAVVALLALVGSCAAFAPAALVSNRADTTTAITTAKSSSSLQMGLVSSAFKKLSSNPTTAAVAAAAAVGTVGVKLILDRPSRTYEEGSVAREYDAWTRDGILEYYWGEHIHLGYYNKEEMEAGYKKKNFIQAKYDFIDEMMKLGGIDASTDKGAKVLDVGCGFGGTSRYLAKALGPEAEVTGITLSPGQVKRGTELAVEQGVPNANFMVMDALKMDFPDNSFDIVWACESGEHMPDKKAYIDEMMRVLKPGGKYVMATWCQRDDRDRPFDEKDERDLKFLYEEWTHPYFISIEAYKDLIDDTKVMNEVTTADWVEDTIASWRHSVWVGIYDPRGFIFKPTKYLKCVRDAYCLERMHRAFDRGLMEYGMFAATKKIVEEEPEPVVEEPVPVAEE